MSTERRLLLKARAGRVLLALLVASAAAGVLWYRRLDHGERPEVPREFPAAASRADMVTRDFRHVETRMDRTIWVLEAKRAEVEGGKARLHAVKITWYGEPGSVPFRITSDNGRVDFTNRSALLVGRVRLERDDGSALETARLAWDEKRNLLRADSEVVITTPTFTFRGAGLVANTERQWVKLDGQVRGEIRGGAVAGLSPS